jgi:hypothetical protein
MMNKIFLFSFLLIPLAISTTVNASPQIETSDNKLVVETSNGRVEINNGNISIRGFNNLSEKNSDRIEQHMSRQTSNSISEVNSNFSYSANTINIDRSNLADSHLLSLKSPDTLRGKIYLDGKVIEEINTTNVNIDLTKLLFVGKHQVKIEVSTASNEIIEMSFKSPHNSISHSSNNRLNHTLNLIVR